MTASAPTSARQDLLHGALINFLNPHPYLFWAAVGAPTVITAWRTQPAGAIAFIAGFYLLLVGSKIVLALLLSRAQQRSRSPQQHRRLLRFSALLLCGAGLFMLATSARALLPLIS